MKFEVAKGYENKNITLPYRKTKSSAGYDFFVAEDTIIPPQDVHWETLIQESPSKEPKTLDEVAAITKQTKAKPTLVPTGVKAKLADDKYLELSVRSSCPLKYWLILANGVGIIDADYYGNPDNDGHIYFQVINLSPWPIKLKAGDCIGQGIIKRYYIVDGEKAISNIREGGFGSTNE